MTDLWKRLAENAQHALQDVYQYGMGDDAGPSTTTVTLVLQATVIDLQFLEINGRAACIKSRGGHGTTTAQTHDKVQWAAVFCPSNVSVATALRQEREGARISYNALRRLLVVDLRLLPATAFLSLPTPQPSVWSCHQDTTIIDTAPPPDSVVVLVLRRTHHTQQQQQKTPSSYSYYLSPFRLDDECQAACRTLTKLCTPQKASLDSWDELQLHTTDWLLGPSSVFPAINESHHPAISISATTTTEASILCPMLQTAVGLCLLRCHKLVLGMSVHVGTGLCVARLPDGTWSAPSAVGLWGAGVGVQFGVERTEYLVILQTQQALDHFVSGSSLAIGGNVGIALGGLGREALGAASVPCGTTTTTTTTTTTSDNDTYDSRVPETTAPATVAPIVAYARAQGLYVGVSLEGSRLFCRDDLNRSMYKWETGSDVTAYDILSGKVATPECAEDLYAALHAAEATPGVLPRPPRVLGICGGDVWQYDKEPFLFFDQLNSDERAECTHFAAQFLHFVRQGVSVQRIVHNTRKERRTLWLQTPEIGSLRLGLVSKLSDEQDSDGEEDHHTLDSAMNATKVSSLIVHR